MQSGSVIYKLLDHRYGSLQGWALLSAVAFGSRSHSYLCWSSMGVRVCDDSIDRGLRGVTDKLVSELSIVSNLRIEIGTLGLVT